MKKLSVYGKSRIDILLNQHKFILGSNLEEKFNIYQSIRQYMTRLESEFRTENNIQIGLKYNDKDVNVKRTLYYEITPTYSILEDFKMGSKSLVLKYMELKLGDAFYFDTINTIDILFESLAEEMKDNEMTIRFNKMTSKQLIKLMSLIYLDEFQKDEFDLSYEEIIRLQLKLLKYITEHNSVYDLVIVQAQLPILTDALIDEIYEMKDCHLLVYSNSMPNILDTNDICVIENIIIDPLNEEDCYYLLNECALDLLDLKGAKSMIKNYIDDMYSKKKINLINEILHYKNK